MWCFSNYEPDEQDLEIASRLISAYQLAQESMSPADRGDGVWAQFIESYYGEMITDLKKGNTK